MQFERPEDLLRMGRDLWGDGLKPTDENIHAAAVGLASSWYRNTEAVEDHAHSNGPWRDRDMVRHNAWATELCRRALHVVLEADPAEVEQVLEGLLDDLTNTLPTEMARRTLAREKAGAPGLAATWVETNGLGNWLAFLTVPIGYPTHWWGAPDYAEIVDDLCALDPAPPDRETFRSRMLRQPWTLSDEQAQFVCDHRYDVGRS